MRGFLPTLWMTWLVSAGVTACAVPTHVGTLPTMTREVKPTPTAIATTAIPALPTATSAVPSAAPALALTSTPPIPATLPPATSFCANGKPTELISRFKTALLTSDGALLASLVSPVHGMDARLFRSGRVVNYDRAHAKFLFQSAFLVDWGIAPGSGLPTKGSFHELMLRALLDVFKKDYTLTCDQIQVGGTTYQVSWPYSGIHYYSAYFPGTQANGNLDWRTWVLGMHDFNGNPFLYAIMQFKWEP
jgi:hypothetical protein